MKEWTDHTIHANGVDLHYWQIGGTPQILLLHGITDSGKCWQRGANALSSEYDLIMLDARGHGLSSTPETGYNPQHNAADALALLDALGIDKLIVWGHSMGGATGAQLAAMAPERVKALILEDPAFVPSEGNPERAEQWANGLRQQQALPLEQLVAWGRENLRTWSADTIAPWAEAKKQVRLNVFEHVREPSTPWQEFVSKITAQTLIITGEPERGAIISPELAGSLGEMVPALQVARIDGAGHCVRYEQFEAYMEAARAFLREL